MQTKLTLRLEDSAIENAKRYAHARDTSVSQLVADYFAQLNTANSKSGGSAKQTAAAPAIPAKSATHGLRGLLVRKKSVKTGSKKAPVDETSYREYLDEKYR